MIVKVLCQMLAVAVLPDGYVWWLVLEVLFTVLASVALHRVVRKAFPYLRGSAGTFRELRRSYPVIITKVKQLFVHKISAFALFQLSPLIIYYYATLTLVAVYGNYMLVVTGFTRLYTAVFNSVTSGIGSLISEFPEKALGFFSELFSLRFYFTAVSCFLFFRLVGQFVAVWVGAEYLLPYSTEILLTVILFIALIRQTVDNYINAYGLFSDIWAPVIEMVLNIGLALWLGHFYGLNGILVGMIAGQTVVLLIWKPYYLFSRGIRASVGRYWVLFGKHVLLAAIAAFAASRLLDWIPVAVDGYATLAIVGIIDFIVFGGILLLAMNLTRCGIVSFQVRIISLLKARLLNRP